MLDTNLMPHFPSKRRVSGRLGREERDAFCELDTCRYIELIKYMYKDNSLCIKQLYRVISFLAYSNMYTF